MVNVKVLLLTKRQKKKTTLVSDMTINLRPSYSNSQLQRALLKIVKVTK